MNLKEFRATARPVSDKLWAVIIEWGMDLVPRENFTQYGEDCVLHEADGKFWPHTWWYAPIAYDTREGAEEELYLWHLEFV